MATELSGQAVMVGIRCYTVKLVALTNDRLLNGRFLRWHISWLGFG